MAWRRSAGQVSLPEVHRSIVVPITASFWRKLLAFSGPGFLVAVGYMDPGNWATDLAGGAQIRLLAAGRRHDLQSHGDPAAAFVHQARRRHRTRSGPGLPRSLFNSDRLVSLDSLRNRHRRLRSGRSGRLGHRSATSLRYSAGVGLRALPRWMCWLCFIFSKKVSATSRRW